MHKRWRAITLGFGLAMLLQGNAAAGEDWLCCRVATIFSGGLAVSLPAPITHFFRRGNSYGLMGGWEHAPRLLLHKLLEQSNQIDVDLTGANIY